jgi:UDP-glucose 4-epimerase
VRVLVTGGSGFIGSHVVDKLRERGITVRIYDMVYPDFRDDIEYYHASLLDLDSLRMAMSKVDAIFHLAAVADVKDAFEEPHYAEAINVRGTINVLEIARKARDIKRVIFGSTTWVYSNTEADILNEDSPLAAPSHIYTATKMAGEYYCQCYSRLYNLPTTILRFGIPYGPRARENAVIPVFIKRALNGEPLTIAGDGSQYRNFVYVEDLAEGNVLALKEIAKNKIYNLDGKEKISIKQIADTIRKILGKVEIQYVEARPGDFSGKNISSELATKELGWEPKVSFEEGVRKYINWFKENQKRGDVEWAGLEDTLESRPS